MLFSAHSYFLLSIKKRISNTFSTYTFIHSLAACNNHCLCFRLRQNHKQNDATNSSTKHCFINNNTLLSLMLSFTQLLTMFFNKASNNTFLFFNQTKVSSQAFHTSFVYSFIHQLKPKHQHFFHSYYSLI